MENALWNHKDNGAIAHKIFSIDYRLLVAVCMTGNVVKPKDFRTAGICSQNKNVCIHTTPYVK